MGPQGGAQRVTSSRIERMLDQAAQCERLVTNARDGEISGIYSDLAYQWRELARQAEQLESERRIVFQV
jgi:hypothetical protein